MNRRDKSDVHNHLAASHKHHAAVAALKDFEAPVSDGVATTPQAIQLESPAPVLVRKSANRLILPQSEEEIG